VLDIGGEEPFVRCERLVEVLDGDTDVMNPPGVHPGGDAI
jgi:hypothetical protein